METQMLKQIRLMRIYLAVITLFFVATILFILKDKNSAYGKLPYFEEINVERINVVEKDGKVKMVISNQQRQSPGMMDGKLLAARQREAGIIFFNTEGDECGGLVYDGNKKGGGMVFSVDQYKQDQIMQLKYARDEKGQTYGLKMWDRPEDFRLGDLIKKNDSLKKLNDADAYKNGIQTLADNGQLGHERFFAGKTIEHEVGIFIKDNKGKIRVKLYVDKSGKGKMEFLNDN